MIEIIETKPNRITARVTGTVTAVSHDKTGVTHFATYTIDGETAVRHLPSWNAPYVTKISEKYDFAAKVSDPIDFMVESNYGGTYCVKD